MVCASVPASWESVTECAKQGAGQPPGEGGAEREGAGAASGVRLPCACMRTGRPWDGGRRTSLPTAGITSSLSWYMGGGSLPPLLCLIYMHSVTPQINHFSRQTATLPLQSILGVCVRCCAGMGVHACMYCVHVCKCVCVRMRLHVCRVPVCWVSTCALVLVHTYVLCAYVCPRAHMYVACIWTCMPLYTCMRAHNVCA